MIPSLIGKKIDQTQKFLEDGTRVPVTVVSVGLLPVVQVRTGDKNGYWSVQLGLDTQKKPNKADLGHAAKAHLQKAPRYLKEIRLDKKNKTPLTEEQLPKAGDFVKPTDVLQPGDIVDVTGISKGKGFAGVVKRHNFKGGPRTHGQSDRERAPGSIGQTTTPGRVYKGKRMAGHMGTDQKTVQNLKVIEVTDTDVVIAGLIPGPKNNMVVITKVGEMKKFVPLLKKEVSKEEAVSLDVIPSEAKESQSQSEDPPAGEAGTATSSPEATPRNDEENLMKEPKVEPKEEENAG